MKQRLKTGNEFIMTKRPYSGMIIGGSHILFATLFICILFPLTLKGGAKKKTELKWKPVPRADSYRVEIRREKGAVFFRGKSRSASIRVLLKPGNYRARISVYNKLGKITVSSRWFPLTVVLSLMPKIEAVTPGSVVLPSAAEEGPGKNILLTIKGENFMNGASVFLSRWGKKIQLKSARVISDTAIRVSVSTSTLKEGPYDIMVTNPGETSSILTGGVTVERISGPVIASIAVKGTEGRPWLLRVLITGKNFSPGCRAIIKEKQKEVSVIPGVYQSSTSCTFDIDSHKIKPGMYDIEIINPDRRTALSQNILTILPYFAVTSSNGSFSDKIVISWKKLKGARGYAVFRAPDKSGPFIQIGKTRSSRYSDTKIDPGRTYYYKVHARLQGKKKEIVSSIASGYSKPIVVTRAGYLLRGMVPGWAQIYSGRRLRGSLFAGGFMLSTGVFTWSCVYWSQKRYEYERYNLLHSLEAIKRKKNDYRTAEYTMYGMAGLTGLVYIFNWIDVLVWNRSAVSSHITRTYRLVPEISFNTLSYFRPGGRRPVSQGILHCGVKFKF